MRGFPLLNVFLVVALFAIAWWPLRVTVADHQVASPQVVVEGMQRDAEVVEEVAPDPTVLRVVATRPIVAIRVEHLGQVIYAANDEAHHEIELPNFSIPEDGVDLWIEAMTSEPKGESLTALKLELETPTGDLIESTLWSDSRKFADSLYLQPAY